MLDKTFWSPGHGDRALQTGRKESGIQLTEVVLR